ncbi:hypothetical protein EZV73_02280 [Acidaminobacter sp. JC074]|uniref:hypothetical protein n=1 Tax=Acidaminobacter sp. JC074 TaxID=2530199 RepID=UPI001F11512B|nr:hypothetical protein [Acidaminobacter sp. JC074]MCH4886373.1 hypothetical protein [Acidaminobacter sp. JC074]
MNFDSIIFIVLHLSNNLKAFESVEPVKTSAGFVVPYEIIGMITVILLILLGASYKLLLDKKIRNIKRRSS